MPDHTVSDRALMADLVAGDAKALEAIVSRWERALYSFAYRYTQNDHATREIVQETFVRVYLKRDRYDEKYPLSSWIFTIAANLCKNKARWRRRHPEVSMEAALSEGGDDDRTYLDTLPADSPTPSVQAEEEEELTLLKQAVMTLPHDLRVSILLHHYENLSYKEISDIVGCSVRGVETRLYRARRLLKIRMEDLLQQGQPVEKKTTPEPDDSWTVTRLRAEVPAKG